MPRAALAGAALLLIGSLCACGGGTSEASGSETTTLLVEAEDQDFVEWTRVMGDPITNLSSDEGTGGLAPLDDIVGDARIIAVGEPVYGAEELTRLKRRMFEYLVRHRGVRTIVAEVGWSEALEIDAYIRTGSGNPEELLTRLRTWTWNTNESLDVIRWMRRYNESVPASKRLRFMGTDIIYTSASAHALRAYLEEVDPAFLERIDETLKFFSGPESDEKYGRIRSRQGGGLLLDVERALDRMWRKRRVYADATSQDDWAIAEHHGQVLRQSVEVWRASIRGAPPAPLRERYLAENVRWVLDREETGGRVFIWSHNSRVSLEGIQDGERMGRHLRRMFGDDLVVIGILFNQGAFRAKSGGPDIAAIEIGPAPKGTIENSLSKVGHDMLIVDLRRATDLVDQWLQSKSLTREAGTRYSDPNSMIRSCILGRRFDAVIFVDTTTASTITAAWRRSPAARGGDPG